MDAGVGAKITPVPITVPIMENHGPWVENTASLGTQGRSWVGRCVSVCIHTYMPMCMDIFMLLQSLTFFTSLLFSDEFLGCLLLLTGKISDYIHIPCHL